MTPLPVSPVRSAARHGGRWAAAATVAALLVTGCGTDDRAAEAGTAGVEVLAAFYPLAYVAERVGGDRVRVDNLTAPGAEPHDLELTPRQVGRVADADLVVHLGGFQPAVDDVVEQNAAEQALDVAAVVPLGDEPAADPDHAEDEHAGDAHAEDEHAGDEPAGDHDHADAAGDPHLWLDPTQLVPVAHAVADRLAAADPGGAATYERNAERLAADLTALDEEFATGLADCERRTVVTSHAAFGHLARRYDLRQVAISGLSPEAAPSPSRLREVQEVVTAEGVTTIFTETLVSPETAQTLADDLGVDTAVLDPLEGLTEASPGDDYAEVMRANLAALRAANGCT